MPTPSFPPPHFLFLCTTCFFLKDTFLRSTYQSAIADCCCCSSEAHLMHSEIRFQIFFQLASIILKPFISWCCIIVAGAEKHFLVGTHWDCDENVNRHWCCCEPRYAAAGIQDGQGEGAGFVYSVAIQHLAQGLVEPPYMRFWANSKMCKHHLSLFFNSSHVRAQQAFWL